MAAQHTDAAAEAVAAELGALVTPRPFSPVLRGLLLTGGAPLYLRAEPQRLPRETTVAIEATPLRRTTRDAAEALSGVLPHEYEAKRRARRAAQRAA
jgi:hypothetical protein